MAEGGKSPGPTFILNTSEAIAKPYELTYPLNAELVANVDEMLAYLFNAMKENEIRVEELEEEVEAIEPPPEPVASTLISVSASITEAQLEAANTTPIVLVAALGAGLMAVAQCISVKTSITTAYTSTANWRLRYNGSAFETITVLPAGLTGAGPVTRTGVSYPSGLQINEVATPMVNVALELSLSGAPGTPGTGVATAEVTLWYTVWDLN